MPGDGGYHLPDDVHTDIDQLARDAAQATRLEHDIVTTLDEQHGYELQRGQAIEEEARALHRLDAARSIQGRCDVKIAECIDGIRTLQDELAELVPRSREPE